MSTAGKDIDYYSKFSPSPLSMKQFLDFGEWMSKRHVLICAFMHRARLVVEVSACDMLNRLSGQDKNQITVVELFLG